VDKDKCVNCKREIKAGEYARLVDEQTRDREHSDCSMYGSHHERAFAVNTADQPANEGS
jgi:hypothetical protein